MLRSKPRVRVMSSSACTMASRMDQYSSFRSSGAFPRLRVQYATLITSRIFTVSSSLIFPAKYSEDAAISCLFWGAKSVRCVTLLREHNTHELIVVAGLHLPEEAVVDNGRAGSRQGLHLQLGGALEKVQRHQSGLVQLTRGNSHALNGILTGSLHSPTHR